MNGETRVFALDGTPLAVLEDADVDWTIELGKLGSGSLTVPATSPKVLADPSLIDPGNLVRHTTAAGYTTTWLILSEQPRKFLQAGSPTGDVHVRALAGAVALLDRATVDAEGGMAEYAADLRPFGPARAGFDDSDWVAPLESGTKADPDFDRDPTYPEGWGLTELAQYIHPESDGVDDDEEGRGLLRAEFTVSADTELTFQLTVDDEMPDFWLAGRQPLAPIRGIYQWQRTFSDTIRLEAGTYAVYAVINNLDRPAIAADNVAHLLYASVDQNGSQVLISNTTDWKAWPTYPTVIMPGESSGIILGVLVGEGKTRGSLPSTLTTSITDTQDSGSVTSPGTSQVDWSHETAWTWRVRHDTVLTVLQDLQRICSIDHADIAITTSGPRLDVWQTYGADLTSGSAPVRLGPGAVDAWYETQPPAPNDVWIRNQSGWSPHEDTDAQAAVGLIEGGDTVGLATVPETIDNAGDVVVTSDSALPPRVRVIVADTDRVKCGRDWRLGDTVLTPTPHGDAAGRVIKLKPTPGSDEQWDATLELDW